MQDPPDRPTDPDLPEEASTATFVLGRGTLAEPGRIQLGVLEPGSAVGRYAILDRIGSGGMGVVYAAHDPELDRKVAIKLLRPDRTGAAAEEHRIRLQREAQAIARLSHPHVVAVYDAGTLGEQVFVAMEFVEGKTLRQWLAEGKRPWQEIVGVFAAAGRGLAAAHDAGLVHRDFKPDNVLMGRDGRIKVADFGLARPVGEVLEDVVLESGSGSGGGLLASPITQWGMVMGTPAYMAPEQLRGHAADARSDQFSFCVALWEALYGQKPFPGVGMREILDAERRGDLRDPPEGTGVPARLLPVLRRGLAASPEARYAGMAELLHDLEHDPGAARRRWLALAAVVLAAGALSAGLGYVQARRAELCGGAEEKLAGVWDAPRKQAVRTAFLATGAPFAGDVWKTVETTLDRYTSDWTGMRRQACEATRLQGEQSEDLLDRRMLCLDQHLQDAAAVIGLFGQADFQIVDKAIGSVQKLPPVGACADLEMLRAEVTPPRDPKLRARVESVRARVAEARALKQAGKRREALPIAQAAAQAAAPVGYGPLTAEALYEYGFLQDLTGDLEGSEETLFNALLTAQAAGHQEVAARSAAQLSWVIGFEQSRTADGEKWARQAQSIAEGARGGPRLRSELLLQLSAIRAQEQRFQEALDLSTRALALAEKVGRDNPGIPSILNNMSQYYNQLGRQEEALRLILRCQEIRKRTLPPDHPDFAGSYNTLGNVYTSMNRNQEAAAAFERSLDIDRRHYGPKHWWVAGKLLGLATAHQNLGHLDLALRQDRQALEIFEANFGPEHPYDAMTLVNMGEVLLLQGKPAEALASHQKALAIQEKTLGADNPSLAYPLASICRELVELGRPREAIPAGERSVALFESQAIDPGQLNMARFYLATALWEGGGDRGRAVRLARQARAVFQEAGAADSQREVEDWLRQRGQGW
ncbi:MAG TPA: serine/threonine-protein kinase [Thermoanaerobaculia bacterium]|nr:serine/threonine-protein kinase [Thermoanaerobaculia bacterium]